MKIIFPFFPANHQPVDRYPNKSWDGSARLCSSWRSSPSPRLHSRREVFGLKDGVWVPSFGAQGFGVEGLQFTVWSILQQGKIRNPCVPPCQETQTLERAAGAHQGIGLIASKWLAAPPFNYLPT